MKILYGKSASSGVAFGRIRLIRRHHVDRDALVHGGDTAHELKRLNDAVLSLEAEFDRLYESALARVGESEAAIFEIHKMMLDDEDFMSDIRRLIREEHLRAESAVRRAGDDLAERFRRMESEYMRARAADVLAVSGRLAGVLAGEKQTLVLDTPSIIAADDLTPAETISLDRDKVLGFVTSGGSTMSHTAILARMMGIPAVVNTELLRPEYDGMQAILDGNGGFLCLEPDSDMRGNYEASALRQREESVRLERIRGQRCVNEAGERIRIVANVGEPGDVDTALRCDAEGIGLYRSEFLFMRRSTPPTEEEQFGIYKSAAEKMNGAECVVRTLDVGADKRIPYLTGETHEANPALGIRAVRLCLRMPELLHTQFRALYRAAVYGNLAVMIPMIALPSEVERVWEIAAEARDSLTRDRLPWKPMKMGIMIETPSAAILADLLSPIVDFFSIGTNDLIQYTLAADRENPDVAYLTKPLPESVRRCIRMTCTAARRENIPVSVCGELGADTDEINFLLECGVTKLSVAPKQILRVREKAMEAVRVRI